MWLTKLLDVIQKLKQISKTIQTTENNNKKHPTAIIIINDNFFKSTFPLRWSTRYPFLLLLFNMLLEERRKKSNKLKLVKKEKVKISLVVKNKTGYSTQKTNLYKKVIGYKI